MHEIALIGDVAEHGGGQNRHEGYDTGGGQHDDHEAAIEGVDRGAPDCDDPERRM